MWPSFPAVRSLRILNPRLLPPRHLSVSTGKSRVEDELPVFQYVGERSRRKDRVFVWGFSYTGALGIPSFLLPDTGRKKPKRFQLTPYRLDMDEKIAAAACGYGFTLLSSKTGDITKVWGMGLNKDSQIGFHRSRRDRTKGYEYILEPSPVPLPLDKPRDTRVLQVSCGRAHSLILTDKEGVFSMGNNSYGQCGRKIIEGEIYSESQLIHRIKQLDSRVVQVSVPRHLPFPHVGTVKQVACGGTGCAALNGDGNVFVWGYGILGKGPNLMETQTPEMIPPTLFGLSDFSPDVRVAQIYSGLGHFAAVNNRGELFVWGKNLRGCLGTGRNEDQYFPWRVTVPGEVVAVACGVDHMMALVKSFT
ncbi:hypothetical protein FKM82_008786 [Ascaphus truei]